MDKKRPASDFFNFNANEEAKRKAEGKSMSKAQYREWQKEVGKRFRSMSAESKNVNNLEARQKFWQSRLERADDKALEGTRIVDDVGLRRRKFVKGLTSIVDVAGDLRNPFTPAKFEERVKSHLQLEPDALMPGLNAYSDSDREAQLKTLFVQDEGTYQNVNEFDML